MPDITLKKSSNSNAISASNSNAELLKILNQRTSSLNNLIKEADREKSNFSTGEGDSYTEAVLENATNRFSSILSGDFNAAISSENLRDKEEYKALNARLNALRKTQDTFKDHIQLIKSGKASPREINKIKEDLGIKRDKEGNITGISKELKKTTSDLSSLYGEKANRLHIAAETSKAVDEATDIAAAMVNPKAALMISGAKGFVRVIGEEATSKELSDKELLMAGLSQTGNSAFNVAKTVAAQKLSGGFANPIAKVAVFSGTVSSSDQVKIMITGKQSLSQTIKNIVIDTSAGVLSMGIDKIPGGKKIAGKIASKIAKFGADVAIGEIQDGAKTGDLTVDPAEIIRNAVINKASRSAGEAHASIKGAKKNSQTATAEPETNKNTKQRKAKKRSVIVEDNTSKKIKTTNKTKTEKARSPVIHQGADQDLIKRLLDKGNGSSGAGAKTSEPSKPDSASSEAPKKPKPVVSAVGESNKGGNGLRGGDIDYGLPGQGLTFDLPGNDFDRTTNDGNTSRNDVQNASKSKRRKNQDILIAEYTKSRELKPSSQKHIKDDSASNTKKAQALKKAQRKKAKEKIENKKSNRQKKRLENDESLQKVSDAEVKEIEGKKLTVENESNKVENQVMKMTDKQVETYYAWRELAEQKNGLKALRESGFKAEKKSGFPTGVWGARIDRNFRILFKIDKVSGSIKVLEVGNHDIYDKIKKKKKG